MTIAFQPFNYGNKMSRKAVRTESALFRGFLAQSTRTAMSISAVTLLTLVCAGCLEKKIEDTPAQRDALSTEVVKMVMSDHYFESITEVVSEPIALAIGAEARARTGNSLTSAQHDGVKQAVKTAFISTFPAEQWVEPMSGIYSRMFTAQELKELSDFYKTPTGMKLLQTQGIVTSEGARVGAQLTSARQAEFRANLQSELSKRQGSW